jgi:ribonuclease HII
LATLIGIDEAGYGPTLGPLVVSATAWQVPDADETLEGAMLWNLLRGSCTRTRDRGRRLLVADSKRVLSRAGGASLLERTVLAMLGQAVDIPADANAYVKLAAPDLAESLAVHPWYTEGTLALPYGPEVGDLGTRCHALRVDARTNDVAWLGMRSLVLLEGDFNERVRLMRNKANVLIGQVFRLIDSFVRAAPPGPIYVEVDRLGGRTHYRESLMTAFPNTSLQVLEEGAERSAYRLEGSPRDFTVRFSTSGEEKSFPIALASMFSKYLRELFMHRFNAYWGARCPDLKPTAGYYTDAQRWLRDAADTLAAAQVDVDRLVRKC